MLRKQSTRISENILSKTINWEQQVVKAALVVALFSEKGREEISIFPALPEMILGLPVVALYGTQHPAGWWHSRGPAEGPQTLAHPGNPSGLNTASPLPGSHQNPLHLHMPLGTSGTQKSDLEAVIRLYCYTHDAKTKKSQPVFCQFAGQQNYLFPTALGT